MKKKFTFLAFLLCLLCGFNTSQIMAQETILIGDEANAEISYSIPFDFFSNNNICQQLFTVDEINHDAGVINSIAVKFWGEGYSDGEIVSGTPSENTFERKVAIYINNTDISSMPSNGKNVPNDQVANFDGTITFSPGEWAEFVFTTPFEYTGQNIIVTMYDYTNAQGGWNYYYYYVNKIEGNPKTAFRNGYDGTPFDIEKTDYYVNNFDYRTIMEFTFAEEGGDVVIGDENSIVPWSTLPFDLYYSYYVSQQLFTSDEIKNTSGGTISSIAVKFFGETNSGTASSTDTPSSTIFSRDVEVYISSTDLDNLTGGVNLASNQTANFDGTVTFTPGEWTEFEFTTPYLYDGGNIIITMYDKTGESGTGNYTHFYAEEISYRAIQSGSTSDPYSLTSLASIGNTVQYRNQMQIKFDDSAPKPFTLTASAATETIYDNETVKLTAKAKGGSGNYTYSWSPATGLDNATIANPTFTPTAAGTYTFTCTVSDGTETLTADVTVTVLSTPIEIGSYQTASYYLPTNINYKRSLTQQIYTSAEIGKNENLIIKSIAFKEVYGYSATRSIAIYMRNTTDSNCTSTSQKMVDSELVYDGAVNFAANDWTTITFSTPFEYYAGKNILLCIVDKTGTYTNYYPRFAVYNTNDEYSSYIYDDYTSYNVTSTTYSNNLTPQKNHVKFEYEIAPPKAPEAPVLTASVASETSALLSWNSVNGALGYYVYNGSSLVATITETSFALEGLTTGAQYCYTVSAYNEVGESELSNQECVTPEKIRQYRIQVSTSTHVHYGKYLNINSNALPGSSGNNTNVNVSAYAESNNQIFTLEDAGSGRYYLRGADGYYIKCGTNNLGKAWNVYAYSTTEKTPILFDYVDGSNFYLRDSDKTGDNYFKVENGNIFCNAPSSNTDVVTWVLEEILDLEPETPEYLMAVGVEGDRITLSWSPAENATGYNVYKNGELVANVSETEYTVTGLNSEEEYCFSVAATRGENISAVSSEVCQATAAPVASNLEATASSGEAAITLTWDDVKATGYNVYRRGSLIAENVQGTTYTDSGLDILTTYCYTIRALNKAGNPTASSNEVCAQTFDGIPIKIIGEGTYTLGSTRVPTNTNYLYSVSQQIYTQSEIGLEACEISKIAIYQTSSYSITRDLEIYMVNTDKVVFSSNTDWVNMSDSLKVFDGSYTFVPGWCEIELAKDFSYEGENILLCVIDNTKTSTSTISFKQNKTPSSYQTLYHFTDSGNYGPFVASNLTSTGTRQYQNTYIKLFYKILPDGVTPTPEEITFANAIRGGNYWSEKDIYSSVEKVSLKAKNTAITNISLSDNSFFTIPANINLTADPVEFNIGHKANTTAGTKNANLIVTHSIGTTLVPLSATVYEPATADVFEKAQDVTINVGENTLPDFANLHDDYILPGEVNEGITPDAVYKFVLAEDAMLDINITGTNAVTALYKEDFNGVGGPTADNDYKLSSTKFFFDFESGDFSGLTLKDADGDGRNWEIISDGYDGSNYCARSYSNDGYLLTPENYIITDKKYYITESSVLSFYATSASSYRDSYQIEYSEDGIDFQVFKSTEVESVNNFELHEIDLSPLAGKDVYLAINHYSDMEDNIRIDDLRLSDGTDAQSDIYPAGTYYLVAAAEGNFTVNITKTALPKPEAITYTSPANNAMNQANPELCFELGKYTTEYRVLLGLTNPPTTVEKDWTSVTKSDYINSFQTEGLNDNTKYYWKVEARNSSGTTEGAVYSFVTPLNKPTDIATSKTEMFTSEEAIITWTAAKGASYYNVYASGERVNTEPITKTTYTLSNLARRMDPGYDVTVTAVHALGESAHSDTVNIKVSGECDLIIRVVNTVDSILEGAEVSFYGINEFGNRSEFGPFVSDTSGQVSQRVHMLKSGEFYYVNVIKAPYTTITDSALIPYDYLLYGNYQITITMNLPAPANFRAENDKIYEGDDLVLYWDEVVGATSYKIYVDGELNAEVPGTTHTISGLAFNQSGYNVTVTAVLPEGESIHSDPVIAKVGGTFTLVINVKDNNDNTLADADVTITLDNGSYEFDAIGNNLPDSLAGTTDANGKASFTMPLFDNEPGHNIYYTVAASKTSYKNSSSPLGHYGYAVEGDAFITNGGVYEFDCTLLLAAPENFKAEKDYYVEGKSARFYWDAIDADNLLGYNFYYSEWDEETYETNYIKLNSEYITNNRYTVEGLEYGQQTYCVTAVYDLGESPMAYAYIQVTGYGSISGTVTDESSNPISDATVMITGKDQFDTDQTYFLTTDANGKYSSNEIMPSTWDPTYQYTAIVSKADYFNGYSSSPIFVEYNETTEVPTIVLQAKPSVDITVTATVETDYNDDEYVQIGWSSVGDAENYNIYRKVLSNNDVTKLNDYDNITWTNHTDNEWMTLPNGNYQYGVSAMVKNYTTESFEDSDTIPTGWKLKTDDFLVKPWLVHDASTATSMSYKVPRSGNKAIYRRGESNDGGEGDGVKELANHIITTPIDMIEADHATLSFYYVSEAYDGFYANTLIVYAREVNTDVWDELYLTTDKVSDWTEVTLSLDAYAGKRIEIIFGAHSNWGKYVAIDDITVTLPSAESKINWSSTLTKQGIEFTGDGNWNVVGNWNTGEVPGESANVSISGDAIINTDVTVRTLTIAEGGSLNLQSGTLTVTEGMTNEIASAFVIEDGAQVVQSKDNVKATFNMNIEAPNDWDNDHEKGWQFIASPMKDAKTASFETEGTDFDLFKYEGEKELEWVNYKGHNEDVISGETHLFDFATDLDNWGVIDANGDGYSWGHILTDELHSEYMMGRPEGYDDAGCLFNEANWYDLDSYTQVNVSPDDYLVAPYMMNIGKYSALRFKMKGYSSMTETPEISVLVSLENKATGEYVPADFTTVGIAPQLNAVWEEVIISLEEYAGENVRVTIRHNVQDSENTAVLIDKVELANIGFETEFKQGRGYLASYETTSTVKFAGVLSNETGHAFNEMKPYNADDYYANFYLLGNPFAFNMDWTNVTAEGLASGYATVTLDGTYEYATDSEIKVGDGFFVKVIDAEPSLSYYSNNGGMGGMRSRRADKKSYLNLVASSKSGSDNVIINFTDNDEEGFDKLENFNKDVAEIYVKEEGKRYGIMNVETDVEEIELYFSVKRMGEYTINAITEGEFQNVILVDKHTGVETDLTTSHYTFKALSSDHPDRFIIRMGNEVKNDNFVYQSGDELIINAEGSVQIIDIMGRIVYSSDIVNETHRVNTSSFDNAAYIVRILNTNEIKTQKVVIY